MSQPPAPSGANMTYGSQVSYADPGQPDDRLEQARKVQQLLAALKQPGGTSAASVPNTTTPPIPSMPAPASSMPPFPPYPPASTLSQPPYPSSLPPSSAYTGVPPPTVPQMASQPPPNSAGLPPNIMALLHTAQQRQATPTQYGAPTMPGASVAAPAQGGPQFQQLLSYLVCEPRYDVV